MSSKKQPTEMLNEIEDFIGSIEKHFQFTKGVDILPEEAPQRGLLVVGVDEIENDDLISIGQTIGSRLNIKRCFDSIFQNDQLRDVAIEALVESDGFGDFIQKMVKNN